MDDLNKRRVTMDDLNKQKLQALRAEVAKWKGYCERISRCGDLYDLCAIKGEIVRALEAQAIVAPTSERDPG